LVHCYGSAELDGKGAESMVAPFSRKYLISQDILS
jgi:hypothetical protein